MSDARPAVVARAHAERNGAGGAPEYPSWGRYPAVAHAGVIPIRWRTEVPALDRISTTVLPRGYGRSYGDSCLNEGGVLLDVRPLRRFIRFDPEQGTLTCEAGVTLAEVLELIVPRGWFLPVVPGTQTVSIGGAIANDIHGKNHHRAGSFGCHVRSLELLRSEGQPIVCSAEQNPELFAATIGGLGLTGLILSAELALKPIETGHIVTERVRFSGLDEFFELAAASDGTHEYTVAWVDCLAPAKRLGRGVFFRGNHCSAEEAPRANGSRRPALRVPFDLPSGALRPQGLRLFNAAYYRLPAGRSVVDYGSFFFPLDRIRDWNRLYGRKGFLQYQCVIPPSEARRALTLILGIVSRSRQGSFLAVLKNFGNRRSPGRLSFPRPGTTLALDLPRAGESAFELLDRLDEVVTEAGGAVYPAKDARMSAGSFRAYFPESEEFERHVDPKFSSSFWRRVGGGGG